MAFTEKQLAQAEGTTSAASIYSPTSGTSIVRQVVVCNHEAIADEYGLWLDNDGTTYTDVTVIAEDVAIAANTTHILDVYWPMADTSGNLAVKAKTASTLTFTIFGVDGI